MIQLPPELLFAILSCPHTFELVDLGRICLVHRSLAPIARAVAKRHRLRRILLASLGFVPQDVLSLQQWTAARGVERAERIWDCFVDGFAHGVGNADIVEVADLFSRFSRSVYRSNAGFPAVLGGSLPTVPKDPRHSAQQAAAVHEATQHRFFLFSNAVVYAALRGLNRRARVRTPATQRQGDEYGGLDEEQREARLRSEYHGLLRSLLRCDPFATHVDRVLRQLPRRPDVAASPPYGRVDPEDCDCACFDRGWASCYLAAFGALVTRYRRFLSPADISHLAYRTILAAVPSFPTMATLPAQALGGPNQQTSSDPLLMSAHLNPDSMLFSLRESRTFAQTKALYNLTEHALAPGLSRLWAGNIGYAWREGGALWQDESRWSAERRMTEDMHGTGAAADAAGLTSATGSRVAPSRSTDEKEAGARAAAESSGSGGLLQLQPIHSVLLEHARWRARIFVRWLDALDAQEEQMRGGEMDVVELTMLEKARSFDIHFIRRALQIQQWAGLDSFSAAFAAQRARAAGAERPPADQPRRTPAVAQVHPSSPFLVFERMHKARRSRDEGVIRSALTGLLDTAAGALGFDKPGLRTESVRQDIEEAGWRAILAPLMTLPWRELEAESLPESRELAAWLLGDLHEGLVHPTLLPPAPQGSGSGPNPPPPTRLTVRPLCIETTEMPPRPRPTVGREPSTDANNDAQRRTTTVFFTDTSPPGAPDTHPFLTRGGVSMTTRDGAPGEKWCEDLTALWPGASGGGATTSYSAATGVSSALFRRIAQRGQWRGALARLAWELEWHSYPVVGGVALCLVAVALGLWLR